MKKRILCIITSIVISVLSLYSSAICYAEAYNDPLFAYKQRLEFLNNKYNLDYGIPDETVDGEDYSYIVNFFSKMSFAEFDNYILSLKDNTIIMPDELQAHNALSSNNISTYAKNEMQRYFYSSSNYNYFYVYVNTSYSDGYQRYTSVNDVNYVCGSYPSQKIVSYSYSFSNNYRNLNVVFTAQKYKSKTVKTGSPFKVTIPFKAQGGDVHK